MLFRILSIIVLLIIAGIALGTLLSDSDKKPAQQKAPPGFSRDGNIVTVPKDMSDCSEGEYCIVVDRHCGLCCDFIAINSTQEIIFDKGFTASCKGHSGEMCQCYDLSSYPSCVKEKCEMVEWPE